MARRCELTGKSRQIGHRVSHSNRKTKRRFQPNLLNVTLLSDALNRSMRLRISANALKTLVPKLNVSDDAPCHGTRCRSCRHHTTLARAS